MKGLLLLIMSPDVVSDYPSYAHIAKIEATIHKFAANTHFHSAPDDSGGGIWNRTVRVSVRRQRTEQPVTSFRSTAAKQYSL
jgi:hypothetical protein